MEYLPVFEHQVGETTSFFLRLTDYYGPQNNFSFVFNESTTNVKSK